MSELQQKEWIKNALRVVKRRNLGLLSNLMGRPRWKTQANARPWFDLPDAVDTIAKRYKAGEITAFEKEKLEKWVSDGYIIIDDAIPISRIDAMNSEVDALWTAQTTIPGLTILGPKRDDIPSGRLPHSYLINLPLEERERIQRTPGWRIHEFHLHAPHAEAIYTDAKLKRWADLLFGRPATAFASINFHWGSGQELHQDMGVFHIYPHNYLIGAWLACEDISPDSGPLSFCPGSHRSPMFEGFKGYPQVNLRTCDAEMQKAYQRHIGELAAQHPVQKFIAKKGQVLFWHGQLVHGGSTIKNSSLTRRSFVIHYSVPGANREDEIAGPYNW